MKGLQSVPGKLRLLSLGGVCVRATLVPEFQPCSLTLKGSLPLFSSSLSTLSLHSFVWIILVPPKTAVTTSIGLDNLTF